MNNYYRNGNSKIRGILVISLISISIPLSFFIYGNFFNKKNDVKSEIKNDRIYDQIEMVNLKIAELINSINNIQRSNAIEVIEPKIEIKSEEITELNIRWLNSPVTQVWNFDNENKMWFLNDKYGNNLRSVPTVIIGLREDGVVVWKNVVK